MPQPCLPNGLPTPDTSPAAGIDMRSAQPQRPPYLDAPPEVIDVSRGRQLFVDDFLVKPDYQRGMTRVYHEPVKHPGNPVLFPQSPEETDPAFAPCAVAKSGGVWFDDADEKFKIWYMTGYLGYAALATSDDGIHWERPQLDVVPGTNLILPRSIHPDSGSVIIDHHDPDQRYKMMLREPNPLGGKVCFPARLLSSPDGIHWQQVGQTGDMHDRSTLFFNPLMNQWAQSVRLLSPHAGRCRYLHQHSDFLQSGAWTEEKLTAWQRADEQDQGKFGTAQLYNFDAIAYESIMLGFHQILHGPPNHVGEAVGLPKLTELYLGVSRDGFHWHRPVRTPLIGARRAYGSWEYGYVESSAGMCLIVGDELWIYYSAYGGDPSRITESWHTNGTYANGAVGIAKLRRDGFASMRPMYEGAITQTRKLRFTGRTLFVNANTVGSNLTVQALDEAGKPIPGLTHADCLGLMGNSTCAPIRWKDKDLTGLGQQKIRLQFRMSRGDLYAFWITNDPAGKSGGYVAAGGPGFTGPTDD